MDPSTQPSAPPPPPLHPPYHPVHFFHSDACNSPPYGNACYEAFACFRAIAVGRPVSEQCKRLVMPAYDQYLMFAVLEERVLCLWLALWSARVWYKIHHGHLDYSTDPSMCGLLTTKTPCHRRRHSRSRSVAA